MLYQIFALNLRQNQNMTRKTRTIAAMVTWLTNSKEMRTESEHLAAFFQEPSQAMKNHDCKVRSRTQKLVWLPRDTTCCNWYEYTVWVTASLETISLSKKHKLLVVTESFNTTPSGISKNRTMLPSSDTKPNLAQVGCSDEPSICLGSSQTPQGSYVPHTFQDFETTTSLMPWGYQYR